ncbi:unnamed protein product [Linum trigynum]|uniref:Uncharacterized protein n=1 Tax=Linum trigynum TaxID=586398 RepID=A0AAV2DAS3_9ROSI
MIEVEQPTPSQRKNPENDTSTAVKRTKHQKGLKSPKQKAGTPMPPAKKALQIWSPVKDKKRKARARTTTLTLQDIKAWTSVASVKTSVESATQERLFIAKPKYATEALSPIAPEHEH